MPTAASTSPGASRKPLLAHPQDVHCIIYHAVCLCAYAAAFWIWQNPQAAHIDGPWSAAAFVIGAGYLLGWISGVDVGVNFHNHTHRRIFRSRALNRWFGRFWTFSGGWPSFYWDHLHVVVHHANVMEENDWTMPHRRADGRFENIYSYVLKHWPWRFVPAIYRDFRNGRGGPGVGRKALKELGFFLVLWSIPFWIDPLMALCLWVFPQWIGNSVTMGAGMYVQHAGCVPKSSGQEMRHSNCYLSPFFNLTMFNIGYHVLHHDHPYVHWSDLPQFHVAKKAELVAGGAHVVPYGFYHAAHIMATFSDSEGCFQRFVSDQAPGYGDGFNAAPEITGQRELEQPSTVERPSKINAPSKLAEELTEELPAAATVVSALTRRNAG